METRQTSKKEFLAESEIQGDFQLYFPFAKPMIFYVNARTSACNVQKRIIWRHFHIFLINEIDRLEDILDTCV